jgi:putative membrane protein PagO
MATLYLGAVAGVFGILCYFALQQRAGPFRASLAFLVFPVIAVGLDAWLANTPLSPASLLLMLPLGLGILLTLAVAPRPVLHTTSE